MSHDPYRNPHLPPKTTKDKISGYFYIAFVVGLNLFGLYLLLSGKVHDMGDFFRK